MCRLLWILLHLEAAHTVQPYPIPAAQCPAASVHAQPTPPHPTLLCDQLAQAAGHPSTDHLVRVCVCVFVHAYMYALRCVCVGKCTRAYVRVFVLCVGKPACAHVVHVYCVSKTSESCAGLTPHAVGRVGQNRI